MGSKAQKSCDQCRARKIKCHSNDLQTGNSCIKCVDADIQCTFTYKRKKRKPNIAIAQSTQPFDFIHSLIEDILSSNSYTVPSDPTRVHDIIVSLAKYARSVDRDLTHLRNAMMGGASSLTLSEALTSKQTDTGISEEESSDDGLNTESFKQISLGHSSIRHFGKSSNIRFIHNIMNRTSRSVDLEPLELDLARFKRPEYWGLDVWKLQPEIASVPAYNFPEIDLLWDLLRIYFIEVGPYIPLLHRPTFEKAVINGRHLLDHNFGAVVLAVCAIAARDSKDPRVFQQDAKITAGWQWFRQIRLVRPNFVEPTSVHELQLYCLAYIYLRHTNMHDSVWPLVGLGLRSAIDRGIHRLKASKSRTVESELCIRVFWILRNADVLMGMTLGRPTAIYSEDFDIDRPVECDDEYWEVTEHNGAFTQPAGKISVLSFFTHYSKLMDIAASVQRSIYCINEVSEYKNDGLSSTERSRKKVMQHDSALNDWLTSLPEHLRWDPHQHDKIHLNHSAILYTTFYWIQLQVHKNFIIHQASGNHSQEVLPSFVICANAARTTVRISRISHQRSKNHYEILLNLAHCGTVLNLILWRHKRGISPTPYADIKAVASDVAAVVEMLTAADSSSQTVGRVADKLNAFAYAEGLLSNLPTGSAATSKRTRRDETDDYIGKPNLESQMSPISERRPLAGSLHTASYIGSMVDPRETSVLSGFDFESPGGRGFNDVRIPQYNFVTSFASPSSPATEHILLGENFLQTPAEFIDSHGQFL
ncbi:fungal-specific transcription factor domain-containing protein [Lentinula aciculospora]|uniref:Fungal-specific transcription factor domain-containing protein n=1 Tax=Lentinula aciculospora TaxID=153920 RepID=A0A9W9AH19_9AGAR|nr:fungal-specific transcription factor domain-containing protein [Lentinula aciculospora]